MKDSFWSRLVDLIAPRACVVCGGRLGIHEFFLCGSCNLQLPRTNYADNPYENDMARLFWGQLPIERVTSFFYYSGKNHRRIIHNLKYKQREEVGEDVGALFAEELMETGFFDGIDGIVTMPLHHSKLRERGYNQCDSIARGIQKVTGIPIIDGVVERMVNNETQTHKNIVERKENVKGIFRLKDASLVEGKHILLVDDVLTTGSTLISCGSELAKAPNVRISICTLAYAGELVDSINKK